MQPDKVFVLFDLDRTLCDSMEVGKYYISQLKVIAPELVPDIENELRSSIGKRYDLMSEANKRLSPLDQEKLAALLGCSRHNPELYRTEGATEVLNGLDAAGVHFGVITYGNPSFQRYKLDMIGLSECKYFVTHIPGQKATLISSWRSRVDGFFVVPPELGSGAYERILLVDDKSDELLPVSDGFINVLFDPEGLLEEHSDISYAIKDLRQLLDIMEL